MKICNSCGNKNLIVSTKKSDIIKGANYVACLDCGNIMLILNDEMLPTPTSNTPQTKLLIQDAANCFDSLMVGGAASLNGKTTPTDIQPSQALEGIQDYINHYLCLEEYFEEDDPDECEGCDDCCSCVCDIDTECTCQENSNYSYIKDDDYLLILPSGEKQIYRNCSKDFMMNIINDIGSNVKLFNIKEIELKSEVKYTF